MTKKIDHDRVAELWDDIEDKKKALDEAEKEQIANGKWIDKLKEDIMDLNHEYSKAKGEEDDMDDDSSDVVSNLK